MDGRWSTNQFNTSTAISLITLLLRRNGFHLATVPSAGTRLEYFIDVYVVLFKMVVIRRVLTAFVHRHIYEIQAFHNSKQQGVGVLHMCCGFPGPQGGARSTDTGPAHEPAVCSLPAAERTQHRVDT